MATKMVPETVPKLSLSAENFDDGHNRPGRFPSLFAQQRCQKAPCHPPAILWARRARAGRVNRQKCRIGGFRVTHVELEACHRQPIVRMFALTAVLFSVLSHHVLQLSVGPPLSCREEYECPRISVF